MSRWTAPLRRLPIPTRRALLARLGEDESISVSELAQPFSMSLPAIMKHLDVLSDAGLVARAKTGRIVACRLTAGPMEQAMDWLNRYQRFWSEGLDRLALLWRKNNGNQIKCRRRRRQAEPQFQTSSRCPAGESLRGVDRPAKNSPMVRAAPTPSPARSAPTSTRGSAAVFASAFRPIDEYYEIGGVYREVVPNQRLVFSWAWHSTPERESLVTVTLKPDGDGTLLTLAPRAAVRSGSARRP